MAVEPDVFGFRDYRAYLKALYEHKKGQGRSLSLRAFSRRAALRSPNYLKLVMDGERNLTPEMARRFAGACGLRGQGQDYFTAPSTASTRSRSRSPTRTARFA